MRWTIFSTIFPTVSRERAIAALRGMLDAVSGDTSASSEPIDAGSDPTPARIRRARPEISAECGHDPEKLVQRYIDIQQRKPNVSNPPCGSLTTELPH